MKMRSITLRLRRASLALLAGTAVSLFALTVLGFLTPVSQYPPTYDARYYLALFKHIVGLTCIIIGLYFEYGPDLYYHDIARRWMPPKHVPAAVVAGYVTLGLLVLFTGVYLYTSSLAHVITGQVFAFAGFLGFAVGFAVYCYERSAGEYDDAYRDDNDQP